MKKNMGTADRVVRGLIAVAAAGLYLGGVVSGPVAIVIAVFGVIMLATSAVSFCPLYVPLGLSTCPRTEDKPEDS